MESSVSACLPPALVLSYLKYGLNQSDSSEGEGAPCRAFCSAEEGKYENKGRIRGYETFSQEISDSCEKEE